jgi:hypothetical protein
MTARQLTGWQRLGIVLALLWISLATAFYFGALVSYGRSALTQKVDFLFEWLIDPAEKVVNAMTPMKPVFSAPRFLALVLAPVLVCWLAVRAVHWIRAGFRINRGSGATP